jgi:hypothetical protein
MAVPLPTVPKLIASPFTFPLMGVVPPRLEMWMVPFSFDPDWRQWSLKVPV